MSIKTYTFKVTAGPLAGQEYPVSKESMNLGRSSTCDIAIKDLLLSRTHCRFELRDNKLFVTDLASANETLVNGVAVDEKELFHNDLVEVGETTMKVVSDPPETNPAAATAAAAATTATPTDAAGDSGDVLIDLGFNNADDESADEKKIVYASINLEFCRCSDSDSRSHCNSYPAEQYRKESSRKGCKKRGKTTDSLRKG